MSHFSYFMLSTVTAEDTESSVSVLTMWKSPFIMPSMSGI